MTDQEKYEFDEFVKSLDSKWDKKCSIDNDSGLSRSDWERSIMMRMKKSIHNIKNTTLIVNLYDGKKRKTFPTFQKCKNAMCRGHMQLNEIDVYKRIARYICSDCSYDNWFTDKELRVTVSPGYEERYSQLMKQ